MIILKLLFIYCLCCMNSFSLEPENQRLWYGEVPPDADLYRLPTDIIPEHYVLSIITVLNDDQLFGHANIVVRCICPTKRIILHSKHLQIDEKETSIKDLDADQPIDLESFELDSKREILIMHTKTTLKRCYRYLIYLKYSGELHSNITSEKLNGFYSSNWKGTDKMAVTQFQPSRARKAFPCFDEPAMKATFDINIGRQEGYISLSNMPLKETIPFDDHSGWYWDMYERSVLMSTYIVAFAVCNYTSTTSSIDKRVRVWTRSKDVEKAGLALDVASKALLYFDQRFKIKYILPKLDLIAVPKMFAGGMENWGLIVLDKKYSLSKQPTFNVLVHSISHVVCHEVAHQWFGNLVTCKWWTNVWLNEGFAEYMATEALDHIFPEWKYNDEYYAKAMKIILDLDALNSSHPVRRDFVVAGQVHRTFDSITYKKGGILLRMLTLTLGEKPFYNGVNNYLLKHQFGSVVQEDLFESLTVPSKVVLPCNISVKTVMDSWTLQSGYPIISVERNYKDGTAVLKQTRFMIDDERKLECWFIPITYTTQSEMNFKNLAPKIWMTCPEKNTTKITGLKSDEWLILNLEYSSLVRVNYDMQNWKMISETLNSANYNKIPFLTRLQILNDISQLSHKNYINYETVTEIIEYSKFETNPHLLELMKRLLKSLGHLTKNHSSNAVVKEYANNRVPKLSENIYGVNVTLEKSKENDSHTNLVISYSCKYGIPNCEEYTKKAKKKLEVHLPNCVPKKSSSEILLLHKVYCSAIKDGGDEEWNFLFNEYKKSDKYDEKIEMMKALGCSTSKLLLQRCLKHILEKTPGIDIKDKYLLFRSVVDNEHGLEIARDFFYSNFDAFHDLHIDDHEVLKKYLKSLSRSITNEQEYEEFSKFVENNKDKLKSMMETADILEGARSNLKWQHKEEVERILKRRIQVV